MIHVNILGLRELNGRFGAMRDRELATIQMEEAHGLAKTLEDIYRRRAPRSAGLRKDEDRHFYEGIDAKALATAFGFQISVDTDKPVLARWLREGTRPHTIEPREKQALWWPHASHPVRIVHHPGTRANPWEHTAEAEAAGLAREVGSRIGSRVVLGLGGGLGVR